MANNVKICKQGTRETILRLAWCEILWGFCLSIKQIAHNFLHNPPRIRTNVTAARTLQFVSRNQNQLFHHLFSKRLMVTKDQPESEHLAQCVPARERKRRTPFSADTEQTHKKGKTMCHCSRVHSQNGKLIARLVIFHQKWKVLVGSTTKRTFIK